MRRLLILAVSVALAGCTGSTSTTDVLSTAATAPSQTVASANSISSYAAPNARGTFSAYPARFGDNDPYEFTGITPRRYRVHGTDVSKYQTHIDWHTARRNGINFAFIKATEGGDHLDSRFHEHWRNARAANVHRGAYHFYYFCRTATEQASWFMRNVPRDRKALPPVLDMEWNHQSRTCKKRPSAEKVRAEMAVWLRMVQRHYGKKPIIYTTRDFYKENQLWKFQGYEYWLRSTAGHPSEHYGRQAWSFWQYTGTGVIPGIKGNADINAFNGTASEWNAWLKKNGVL